MSITSSPIIPGLAKDLNPLIIHFSCDSSLLNLSAVNHCVNSILNNDFFKKRFNTKHPLLTGYRLFETLQKFHPNNCWKVAYFCFSKKLFNIPFSVFVEATPLIRSTLQAEKEPLQLEIKEICGDFPFDPRSKIHRAWEAMDQGEKKLQPVQAIVREIIEELKLHHSETQMREIAHQLQSPAIVQMLLTSDDRIFQNQGDEDPVFVNSPFNRDCTLMYVRLASIIQEFNPLATEVSVLITTYFDLERKRIECQSLIDPLDAHLKHLNLPLEEQKTSPFYIENYSKKINNDHQIAVKLERAQILFPVLDECACLIGQIIKEEIEPTAKDFSRIAELINSCTCEDVSTLIWKSLYLQCANNVIEDRWSEKHFQEHLPQLSAMIIDLAKVYCGFISQAQIHLKA